MLYPLMQVGGVKMNKNTNLHIPLTQKRHRSGESDAFLYFFTVYIIASQKDDFNTKKSRGDEIVTKLHIFLVFPLNLFDFCKYYSVN